jgi:hypothetical protein
MVCFHSAGARAGRYDCNAITLYPASSIRVKTFRAFGHSVGGATVKTSFIT